DVVELLAVGVEIDRLLLLVQERLAQLRFLGAVRLQLFHLVLPIEPVAQEHDQQEQDDQRAELGPERPVADVLGVESPQVVQRHADSSGVSDQRPAAATVAGEGAVPARPGRPPRAAAERSSSAWPRARLTFNWN